MFEGKVSVTFLLGSFFVPWRRVFSASKRRSSVPSVFLRNTGGCGTWKVGPRGALWLINQPHIFACNLLVWLFLTLGHFREGTTENHILKLFGHLLFSYLCCSLHSSGQQNILSWWCWLLVCTFRMYLDTAEKCSQNILFIYFPPFGSL